MCPKIMSQDYLANPHPGLHMSNGDQIWWSKNTTQEQSWNMLTTKHNPRETSRWEVIFQPGFLMRNLGTLFVSWHQAHEPVQRNKGSNYQVGRPLISASETSIGWWRILVLLLFRDKSIWTRIPIPSFLLQRQQVQDEEFLCYFYSSMRQPSRAMSVIWTPKS